MFILLPIAAYAAFFAYLRGIGAISVFDYPSGAAADREQALLSDPTSMRPSRKICLRTTCIP